MRLNAVGEIIRREWLNTVELRTNVELFEDKFVVMPTHVHGIIVLVDDKTPEDGIRRGRSAGRPYPDRTTLHSDR